MHLLDPAFHIESLSARTHIALESVVLLARSPIALFPHHIVVRICSTEMHAIQPVRYQI